MVEDLNGEIPRCVDGGREKIQGYRIRTRPLKKSDFDTAFDRIRVDAERGRKLESRFQEFARSN
jgi:hypothetical protein